MDNPSALTPQTYVQQTTLAIWNNLPKIVIAGLGFSLAVMPAGALAALGLFGPALLVAVFTVAPAWAALLAYESEIVQEQRASLVQLLKAVPRYAGASIRMAILPLPFAVALLFLLPRFAEPSVSLWQWAGLLICVAALALLLTLYLYAFPLLVQHNMSYGVALRNSALLASRHMTNSVGLCSLAVICGLAVSYFSLALSFFLPALYGMFVVNNCRLAVSIESATESRQTS